MNAPKQRSCIFLILVLNALIAPSRSSGQGITPLIDDTNKLKIAIDRGIQFLLSKQRDDGCITDRQYDTTMTSLSIMALASTGITPCSLGSEGEASRKALDFVLSNGRQDQQGYFGNRDGSRMYGHGITTLMLTEVLGMAADEAQERRLHASCRQALDLILAAQQQPKASQYSGGWRYTPNSIDADLSVSVWQLMALRSAKNDGLDIPAEAIAKAVNYLQRSYSSQLDGEGNPIDEVAGFCYLPERKNPTFAMTAAGLLALHVCGEYESPLISGSTRWLEEHPPKWKDRFFFYGLYYYSQAMHQIGGLKADAAHRFVSETLLEQQQPDGSWIAPGGEEAGAGKVYTTSLAILSLSVRYHYLPIYQR